MFGVSAFGTRGFAVGAPTSSPPSITGTPPNAYIGIPYSWTPTVSGGTPGYTYSIAAGSLPPGLTLNTATGEISGTPTEFINPATLFSGGEQGQYIELSPAMCFLNTDAQTNSTVGQPVGLVLDQRIDAGFQQVTMGNLTFTKVAGGGTLSISGNEVTVTGTSDTVATEILVTNSNAHGMGTIGFTGGKTFPGIGRIRWSATWLAGAPTTRLWHRGTPINPAVSSGAPNSGALYSGLPLTQGDYDALTVTGVGSSVKFIFNEVSYCRGNHLEQGTTANKPVLRVDYILAATELITNGTFPTNTAGWTAGANTSLSVVSGAIRVQDTATSYGYANQAITCEVGKTYYISATLVGGNNAGQIIGAGPAEGDLTNSTSGSTLAFVATQTTMHISLWAGGNVNGNYRDYDNVSVKEVTAQYNWLEPDGVNDLLRSTFTIAQPFDRVSALSHVVASQIFGGVTANGGVLYSAANVLRVYDGAGEAAGPSQAAATGYVVAEQHIAGATTLRIDDGALNTASAGTTLPGGITVANSNNGSSPSATRIYGYVMRQTSFTTGEHNLLRTFYGSKIGKVL